MRCGSRRKCVIPSLSTKMPDAAFSAHPPPSSSSTSMANETGSNSMWLHFGVSNATLSNPTLSLKRRLYTSRSADTAYETAVICTQHAPTSAPTNTRAADTGRSAEAGHSARASCRASERVRG
eukprot:1008310-Rhodomonas_salina.2